MNRKRDSLDLVYNKFNFNKFSINNEEFNQLSDGTLYKHLNKFVIKINEFKKVKPRSNEKKRRKSYCGRFSFLII